MQTVSFLQNFENKQKTTQSVYQETDT